MKTKKYTLPVMIIALMLVVGAATVFAAAAPTAESADKPVAVQSNDTSMKLCHVAGCNTAGVHQHNGKHYAGHSKDDGHDGGAHH